MMELANMDYIISEAKKSGAKLLLVGDVNQLSPVGWAGAFGKVIDICGSNRLEHSRRQKNQSHREATLALSRYQVRKAIDIYRSRINIADNEHESNILCANYFVNRYIDLAKQLKRDDLISIKTIAIGVFSNNTRNYLNMEVRQQLKEAGILKGKEYKILVGSVIKNDQHGEVQNQKHYIDLAIGDQIVFTKNFNHLSKAGIFNGEVGTILKIGKPDIDRLAKIKILLHKSDGKKEKVTLDLQNLAKTRYFHDGISIDHGYAVTAHKVQGASIDHFLARIERGVGYEVFNVLATRHKEDVAFFTDKELLQDVFYQSLDETSQKARSHFEIKNEEILIKEALAKLLSKRTNTSFASDYKFQTPECDIIKKYIDKSEETIISMKKISNWQIITERKTGIKPEIWQNKNLWQEFQIAKENRSNLAAEIKSDYQRFKDSLVQLNINYATIEKHAFDRALFGKIIVTEKQSELYKNDRFKELINIIKTSNTKNIRKAYIKIDQEIKSQYYSIYKLQNQIRNIKSDKQELISKIHKAQICRSKLIPEYLGRIYESNSKALEKYEDLKQQYGQEKTLKMVVKTPSILGNLKGIGFGKYIGFDNERKNSLQLCKNLKKQLEAHDNSTKFINKHKETLKAENFDQKIIDLENNIENLQKLLPSKFDEDFLKQIESKLTADKYSQIDWSDLSTETHKTINIARKSITFKQVKDKLSKENHKNIFKKYAKNINPDGKIRISGNNIFSGSLNMNLSNGMWHRFSDGSGGDIFKFVEEANGCSKYEALNIVADYAGIIPELIYEGDSDKNSKYDNVSYIKPNSFKTKDQWVACNAAAYDAPEFISKKHLAFMEKANKIDACYEYRNDKNQLIGYSVRLINKQTGKKQVLPVSYCYNKEKNKYAWKIKAFQDMDSHGNKCKPIYGLEKLFLSPQKPVLIVEGEKTADSAQKLFPEYIALSPMGGANAVDNVNWKYLSEREVIIWPDNDKAGIKAANKIKTHIDIANGYMGFVHVVDMHDLKLPEKWDLADQLPKNISYQQIKNLLSEKKSTNYKIEENLSKQTPWKEDLDLIHSLYKMGKIDIGDMSSTSIYRAILLATVNSKNIEYDKSQNITESIAKFDSEYQKIRINYRNMNHSEAIPKGNSKAEKIIHKIASDITMLHHIQANQRLPKLHIEMITQTTKEEVSKLRRFTKADHEHAANNVLRIVSSKKWLDHMHSKNYQNMQFTKMKTHQINEKEIFEKTPI